MKRVALQLLLVSFTVLFQELLLIRWLGQQVRILAYFPNIILISAFLGIGLGCLRSGKKDLFSVWPGGLLLLMLVTGVMSRIVFTQEALSEHLWLLYNDLSPQAPVVHNLFLPILGTFILSAVCFVPLGQILANCLVECQRLRGALWGYALDIIGSSLGVAAYTLVSFLKTTPALWFLVLAGCLIGLTSRRSSRLWMGVIGALFVGTAHYLDRADIYSPYYAINVKAFPDISVTGILANGSLHQYALPLQADNVVRSPYVLNAREGYHVPYRMLKRKPRHVLVLGAGTGNDAAVALDEGAEQVDVVEIDPVILMLGTRVHPNQPYQSPKVRRFNTDARSFLNTSQSLYDVIIFGTLDSMTKLSALSNVRLDNFVYTVESLRAAARHLTPDGGMILYFMASRKYLEERLAGLMTTVFNEFPWVVARHRELFNLILMGGPAFQAHQGAARQEIARAYLQTAPLLPHDDWPYLYLERQAIGRFYVQIGLGILAVAALGIFVFSDRLRKSVRSIRTIDWEMLLFGMAFLLLETRGIVAMNLLWGATWFTNAVVIQSIFVTILSGTLLTAWRPLSFKNALAGLFISLGVIYACPLDKLLSLSPALKFLGSVFVMGAPVFFASIAFAILFSQRKDTGTAFGWNLLGAVVGGLLELLSMVLGLKNLVLVAMLCYLGAAWVYVVRPKSFKQLGIISNEP